MTPPSTYRAGWWDQLSHAVGTELFPGLEQGLSLGFYQPSWEPTSAAGRVIRGAARFAGELPAYGAAVAGAAAIPGLGEAEAAAWMPAVMRAGIAGLGLGSIRGIAGVSHGAPWSSVPGTAAGEAAGWLMTETGTRALAPAWNIVKPMLQRAAGLSLDTLDDVGVRFRKYLDIIDKPYVTPSGTVEERSATPVTAALDAEIVQPIQNALKQTQPMQFADWGDHRVRGLYSSDVAETAFLNDLATRAVRIGLTREDNDALELMAAWATHDVRRQALLASQAERVLPLFPELTPTPPELEPKPTLSPAAQKVWDEIAVPGFQRLARGYEFVTGMSAPNAQHLSRFVNSDRFENDMSMFMEEGRITRAGVLSKGLRAIHSLQHQNYFHFHNDQYGDFIGQVDKQGRVFLFRDGKMINPFTMQMTDVLTEDDLFAQKAKTIHDYAIGQLKRASLKLPGAWESNGRVGAGAVWNLSRTDAQEIEAHTPWKFYHEFLPNIFLQLARMDRAVRFKQFLDELPDAPGASEVLQRLGPDAVAPRGWSRGPGPLTGWALHPVAKGWADRWWVEGRGFGPEAIRTLAGTARNLIFILPFLHVSNIGANWTIDRGARWASIPAYRRLFVSSSQALRYLTGRLNPEVGADKALFDYIEQAQRAGLVFMRQLPENHIVSQYTQAAGRALFDHPQEVSAVAKAFNIANPLTLARLWMSVSKNVTWWLDDTLRIQALLEERALGRTPEEAVARISEHVPDYLVPTYVAGSPWVSQIFRSQNFLVFGPYHYGLLKSYGQWAKALLGTAPLAAGETVMQRRAEAAGQLAVLGLMLLWAYPKLDQLAKWVTGNQAAHFGRAGVSRIPYNTYRLATGQTTPIAALSSLFTPNPLWSGVYTGLAGYNPYTKQQEIEPRASAAQRIEGGLRSAATEAIAPLRYGQQIASGQLNPAIWLLSGFPGIQTPKETPAQRKLQTDLYDERTFIEGERTKAFRNGDLSREAELRLDYNQRLLEDITGVLQESGLSPALGQLYFRHYSMKPFSTPSQQRLMTPALPIPMRILRGR